MPAAPDSSLRNATSTSQRRSATTDGILDVCATQVSGYSSSCSTICCMHMHWDITMR